MAVATDLFARKGDRDNAATRLHASFRPGVGARQSGEDGGAFSDLRIDVEDIRLPRDRTEATARSAGCRVAIREAGVDIGHAGAAVEGEALDTAARLVLIGADQQLSVSAVFHEVAG